MLKTKRILLLFIASLLWFLISFSFLEKWIREDGGNSLEIDTTESFQERYYAFSTEEGNFGTLKIGYTSGLKPFCQTQVKINLSLGQVLKSYLINASFYCDPKGVIENARISIFDEKRLSLLNINSRLMEDAYMITSIKNKIKKSQVVRAKEKIRITNPFFPFNNKGKSRPSSQSTEKNIRSFLEKFNLNEIRFNKTSIGNDPAFEIDIKLSALDFLLSVLQTGELFGIEIKGIFKIFQTEKENIPLNSHFEIPEFALKALGGTLESLLKKGEG